jgi:hypothetical protein
MSASLTGIHHNPQIRRISYLAATDFFFFFNILGVARCVLFQTTTRRVNVGSGLKQSDSGLACGAGGEWERVELNPI